MVAASALLVGVSLALTFPENRADHQRAADEAIVRLRVRLRVARDLGLLSAGAHRHLAGLLISSGRMLGGWRKRERHRIETMPPGDESPTPLDAEHNSLPHTPPTSRGLRPSPATGA